MNVTVSEALATIEAAGYDPIRALQILTAAGVKF